MPLDHHVSDKILLRVATDEDIEIVRQWMGPPARAILLGLRLGIKINQAEVARTFGLSRHQVSRLIAEL